MMNTDRSLRSTFFILVAFLHFCGSIIVAQGPATSPTGVCPTFYIDCPSAPSTILTFTAKVEALAPAQEVTYTWVVTNGEITSGQGTRQITVKRLKGENDSHTAVVTLGGLFAECGNSASCTMISCPAPLAARFDTYGGLTFAEERKRLDRFAEQLGAQPGATASLIISGVGEGWRGERARRYLVERHQLDPGRVNVVTGKGGARRRTTLFIVPAGALPPKVEGK